MTTTEIKMTTTDLVKLLRDHDIKRAFIKLNPLERLEIHVEPQTYCLSFLRDVKNHKTIPGNIIIYYDHFSYFYEKVIGYSYHFEQSDDLIKNYTFKITGITDNLRSPKIWWNKLKIFFKRGCFSPLKGA